MNVLVIGSGGREHAICWKIKESTKLNKLYTLPDNSVFKTFSENIDVKIDDFDGIRKLCVDKKIDLVVVGPEYPLSKGIADYLLSANIKVFGPKLKGAVLESSKQVAKEFMYRNYIPTADFKIFYDSNYAKEYLNKIDRFPVVVKADGLCAGKGVRICSNLQEAVNAVEDFMEKRIFGSSGMKIIIEEYLSGRECSVLAFIDGKRYLMLPISRDHKRLNDNNEGPNTGGMGAVAPIDLSKDEICAIEEEIIWRFMEAQLKEKIDYRGVIYFGLMLTNSGPKVLEFNVRFGDPETQAILPLIEDDILDIFEQVSVGELKTEKLKIKKGKSICVVLSALGYPQNPVKGDEISGLDECNDVIVFHAGTMLKENRYFTNGGRVLNIVALGKDINQARDKAYKAISKINYRGIHYRKDIGV
ncbi:MAG: phosphoribosylamine--glycine ligase [Elusimicrobiota bacterium]